MSTSSRVIKNTGYLYFKMGVSVLVSLYATRLVLEALGASDFGLYNIVGGSILLLGFLNDTMSNVSQRFMSYEEGRGDFESKRRIFNVSVVLHLIIAIVTCIMLLSVMSILFNGVLNIQYDRINAAKIIYLSLVISTFLTITNSPYEAVLNAHENMLYYSLVGILEAFLKLVVAFVCVYCLYDKLIVYGVLMALIPLVSLVIMRVYCHSHYDECILSPSKYWDSDLAKRMAVFSGWNFLTSISSILSGQGIGIVLNHYFGTILNAAHGIANQVNGQLTAFSANMKKALNPVIVKNAGAHNVDAMNKATIAGCKFSTYLTLLFAVPCILEMPFILRLWLKNVPEWAVTFCSLQLVAGILLQMTNSASTAIYGQGDIKWYAIYKSIMNVLPVILTFVCFHFGGAPYLLYIPIIVVWGIGGDIVIVCYAKKLCGLSVGSYINGVLLPVVGVTLIMILLGMLVEIMFDEGLVRLISCILCTSLGMFCSMAIFGMTQVEKLRIIDLLNRKIWKKR